MPNLVYDNTFDESGLDGKQPQSWDNYVSPYFKNIRTLLNTTGLDAVNLGVTAGQVTASKALVVDASRNLADGTAGNQINNLTLSGTFTCGTVSITGGSVSGITDLAVADGGTGASTASAARTNLGLVIGSDVQAYDPELQALSGLTPTDGNFIVGNGSTFVTEDAATSRTSLGLGSIATQASNSVSITGGSVTGITDVTVADGGTGASDAAGARTNLGLVIGTNVQAYDAGLADIAGLATSDGNVIVGSGSNWVAESGATARTSLGLGSIATQASDSVSITGGSVTGITDITVADGGTGASNASGARTNLGVSIGSDVQAYDAGLADIAALATSDGNIIVGSGSNWVAESGATARTSLGLGSIATQAADNVSISGGSLTGMTSYSGGSFSGTTGTFSGRLAVTSTASTYEGMELVTPSGDGSGKFQFGVHDSGGSAGRGIEFRRGGSDGFDTLSLSIDNNAHLGIRVAPNSNWSTGNATIQVGAQGGIWSPVTSGEFTAFSFSHNGYWTGSAWKYIHTGAYAAQYYQYQGGHYFRTAAAGTSGADISYSDVLTVLNDGKTGVGTASPTESLDVTGAVKSSAAANNWGYSASFFDRSGNDTRVVAGATSGNSSNIAFWTYNSGTQSQKAVITSDGNVGIGLTPSAWGGSFKALQVNDSVFYNNNGGDTFVGSNYYWDGANNKYINTDYSAAYGQQAGAHIFYTAPSGTAGNTVSFTQAMTLDSSGRLGIGTASPYMNAVVGVAPTVAATTVDETGDLAGAFVIGNNVASNFGDRIPLVFNVSGASSHNISAAIMGERESSNWNSALSFWTNNVFAGGGNTDTIQEKMRITSAGRVGIGTSSPAAKLDINGAGRSTAATGLGSSGTGAEFFIDGGKAYFQGFTRTGPSTGSFVETRFRGNPILLEGGNVGIGLTPSAWRTTETALQLNSRAALYADSNLTTALANNLFINSSGYALIEADAASQYYQYQGAHYWQTVGSGSAGANVSPTTVARMDSDGLKFGTDTAAANALDDYEEGTWTPTIDASSSSPSSITYASRGGCYQKVGNTVHISGYAYVAASGLSGGSGNLEIKGFPYTASSGYTTGYQAISVGYATANGSLITNQSTGLVRAQFTGTTEVQIVGTGNDSWGSGVYEISVFGSYKIA